MPTVRHHPLSGDPVLYAPERAARPHAFGDDDSKGRCPFCAGNENDTPPEIARTGDPWRVRVFPNKYPAVEGHEIIVEGSSHDAQFEDIGHAAEVVEMYIRRYRAHAAHSRYVALFKNHGAKSGASLEHLHSQLMPLPFVPPLIERMLERFRASKCVLCDRPETTIDENDRFRRFAPATPSHAWEQWIAPARHANEFDEADAESLAGMVQDAARDARSVSPHYNVLWYLFPHEAQAHFYAAVIPRMTPMAGFELATGTFIDVVDPAATARRFR